ncbi:hypothetical protein TROLL_96 [Bacillus phage Troll]|uniref:Uncharacterized protein n=1 Tax=Bacillus phage Troll TaxID=1382932 RepID=S5Z872_9CAUD|nr:intron encoded nuclease [Bacillus phage Troll]AGT13666.1 hypothetical protein TROLL_96 [Bacillus phage Troll]
MVQIQKRYEFTGLSPIDKDKLIRGMFESEGYVITDENTLLQSSKKVSLISPEGNNWSVSPYTFKTGVRCPLDSNKSWGERCVATILDKNNIPFKMQNTIFYEDGSRQYMDFFIEFNGQKYDIEYNGRQHYENDEKNKLFAPYEEQKKSDDKKKKYCLDNDIVYVELPYTLNTPKLVAIKLSKYFDNINTEVSYTVEHFNTSKEIVEYYKTHTEEETANRFNVCGSTVRKAASRCGFTKHIKADKDLSKEILDYSKIHTLQETADKFNLEKRQAEYIVYKQKPKSYKLYDEKEVIDFYLQHNMKETEAKFSISNATVKRIMKRNDIKKTRR